MVVSIGGLTLQMRKLAISNCVPQITASQC